MSCVIDFINADPPQSGKTTAVLQYLREQAMREPGTAVYVAPTQQHAHWVAKLRPTPGVIVTWWAAFKDKGFASAKVIGFDDNQLVDDCDRDQVLADTLVRLRLHSDSATRMLIVR